MFVVDTNILVYAVDRAAPLHGVCLAFLEEKRRSAAVWYITWGIAYEFMRVTTHPRVFRQPLSISQAWRFIHALTASPAVGLLEPTDRHARIAQAVFEELPHIAGNLVHDATTAILMREHGLRVIYTRDTDFHRFSFLQPVDPVVEKGA